MATTKDIGPAVLGALEADRSLPLTRGGIVRAIKSEVGWPTAGQLKLALAKLVEDGTVMEVPGGNIPWAFQGKQSTLAYYVFPEVYNAHRDEVDELAKQTADMEMRKRHPKEWEQLYKEELTHQVWKRS